MIGLLQIPAFILIGTALGASSSYVTVVGSLVELVDPGVREIGYIAKHLDGAKNWWQVARALAFFGGFLMLFGARIADGCTSGHGISGIAQLSVGSLVAVTAMFTGGIAAAFLLLRRI